MNLKIASDELKSVVFLLRERRIEIYCADLHFSDFSEVQVCF